MDLLTLEVIAANRPGVPITTIEGNAMHAACLLAKANLYRRFTDSINNGLRTMEESSIAYAVQHHMTCVRCGCDFTGGEQWTV